MSDHIPLDIQIEIIKRLPVKSLIKVRSVSKSWKSLIDSSRFITAYKGQVQHLLVMYLDDFNKRQYASIVVDDSFPRHKVPVSVPGWVKILDLIGTSHGLFCLSLYYQRCPISQTTGKAVLWNPTIRKTVVVEVPNVSDETELGFAVCRETIDPKIVKITWIDEMSNWEVEVFTLSTRAWRSSYGSFPSKSAGFGFGCWKVVINGVVYWLAFDDPFDLYNKVIISFDMTSEEFRRINFPDSLARVGLKSMVNLKESLVILEEVRDRVMGIWMMKDEMFTKLFNVNVNTLDVSPMGLSTEILEEEFGIYKLILYDSYCDSYNKLVTDGVVFSYSMYLYVETLLLLDQPNHIASSYGNETPQISRLLI